MTKKIMTNEESATIAEVKTQYNYIVKSLDELKEIVSLRPGTPLRDSVSLLVIDQIKEQRGSCGMDMTAVAITAVSEHVKEYHTKNRDSSAPGKQAIISDVAKERFKFWGVLATLATLIGERFLNQ